MERTSNGYTFNTYDMDLLRLREVQAQETIAYCLAKLMEKECGCTVPRPSNNSGGSILQQLKH